MLARKCHLNVGNGIWKVQCDWLSMGQECGLRLSRRLWGGMRNDLPEKRLRGRLVSSPNGTKITVQSSALYKLRQWMKTKVFIQAQWKSLWLKQRFMKSDHKCNCIYCKYLCRFVPRLLSDQFSFSLVIFDWLPQKTLMLNAQPSNFLICAPAKIAWGWICWTVKKFCCCSGGTDLVFLGLSGGTWLTILDSRHFSLALQKCWMVAVEAFQIFVTA